MMQIQPVARFESTVGDGARLIPCAVRGLSRRGGAVTPTVLLPTIIS